MNDSTLTPTHADHNGTHMNSLANIEADEIATLLQHGDSYSRPIYHKHLAERLLEQYGPGLAPVLQPGDIQTIFIQPAVTELGSRCHVYALPYPLKEGQRPSDIDEQYRHQWRQIGILDSNNERVTALESEYQDLAPELAGAMAGTYFIHVSAAALARRDELLNEGDEPSLRARER